MRGASSPHRDQVRIDLRPNYDQRLGTAQCQCQRATEVTVSISLYVLSQGREILEACTIWGTIQCTRKANELRQTTADTGIGPSGRFQCDAETQGRTRRLRGQLSAVWKAQQNCGLKDAGNHCPGAFVAQVFEARSQHIRADVPDAAFKHKAAASSNWSARRSENTGMPCCRLVVPQVWGGGHARDACDS